MIKVGTHRAPNRRRQLACAAVGLAVGLLVAYLVTRTGHHLYAPPAGQQPVPWHILRPAHPRPVVPVVHRYVVRSGDCLWIIGRDHGVPWRTLAVANKIHTPYLIHPGQVLIWR